MHFPVDPEQARRFQMAVAEYFGIAPERAVSFDVSHTNGDPHAVVEAKLLMPTAVALEMFNAAAVEPEPERVEIAEEDIQVDVIRNALPASIPGNNPAVRITHIPTGRTVTCSKTRSMLQNKAIALAMLEEMLNA